jgi:GNAT superfamily N-acetyltransferase
MLSTPIDKYWATFFGLRPTSLNMPGCHCVAHAGLDGYQGAWVFRRGAVTIVSAPGDIRVKCERELGAGPLPECTDLPAWGRVFGRPITKMIGPAYDGFVASNTSPNSSLPVRRLTPEDRSLLESLKASCTEEEWDHASIDPEADEPVFGCVVEDRLAGVAQNEPRTSEAVSPGVLTASDWRRRGVGAAVLSAASQHALMTGRLVLYQTLLENQASLRLGESVGVVPYAVHHAFRFAADGGEG